MNYYKNLLPILLSGLWITTSEFVRNELLFKSYWVEHYESLGLEFVTKPVNGIIWTIWSFLFAALIFVLLKKFSIKETLLIAWSIGFVLMWLVSYNLQVLPLQLLIFAVPLSMLEVGVAIGFLKLSSKSAFLGK